MKSKTDVNRIKIIYLKLLYYSVNIFHIFKTFHVQWTLIHLQLIARKKPKMPVVMTLQNHTQNMDVCAHAVIRKISYAKIV